MGFGSYPASEGGGAIWGLVTGTLSGQTDLQAALDAKIATTLSSANILVGNASNVAAAVALSGNVTISNSGVTSIGASQVTEAMQVLADNTTQNFSTSKHGYVPKGTNIGNYLKDDGTWASATLTQNYTDAGSVGTSATDLYTYTSPANLFSINGHKLIAKYAGIFVNSATTKDLKVYFAGSVIFDSSALTIIASSSWEVDIMIIRVSATVVRCSVNLSVSGSSTLSAGSTYTELTGLTLSGTNILKLVGTAGAGGSDNDIVAKLGSVLFFPNN